MQSSSQPSQAGYANARVTKPVEWHGLVVADVFLNNLALGLFLVAAAADLALPLALAPVARLAYPLALLLLLADLACLVLDLGDPWRFHHMLRLIKLGSPMSVGVWCLTLFSLPLTALVLLDLLPEAWGVPRWLHVVCVALALPPAFGSLAYKGVLFSTSAQPGWRDARWLGGYLVSSALALGCGELLTLALMTHTEQATLLRSALGLLIALSALPLMLLVVDLYPTLSTVYNHGQLRNLALVALGGEVVLPLTLLFIGSAPILLLSAVLCFSLVALFLRFVLVYLPQSVV